MAADVRRKVSAGIEKVRALKDVPAFRRPDAEADTFDVLRSGILAAKKDGPILDSIAEEDMVEVMMLFAKRGIEKKLLRGRSAECLKILLVRSCWLRQAQLWKAGELMSSLRELLSDSEEMSELLAKDPESLAPVRPDTNAACVRDEAECLIIKQRLMKGKDVMRSFQWEFPHDPQSEKLDTATEGFQTFLDGVTQLSKIAPSSACSALLCQLDPEWGSILQFLQSMYSSGRRNSYRGRIKFIVAKLQQFSPGFESAVARLGPSLPWGACSPDDGTALATTLPPALVLPQPALAPAVDAARRANAEVSKCSAQVPVTAPPAAAALHANPLGRLLAAPWFKADTPRKTAETPAAPAAAASAAAPTEVSVPAQAIPSVAVASRSKADAPQHPVPSQELAPTVLESVASWIGSDAAINPVCSTEDQISAFPFAPTCRTEDPSVASEVIAEKPGVVWIDARSAAYQTSTLKDHPEICFRGFQDDERAPGERWLEYILQRADRPNGCVAVVIMNQKHIDCIQIIRDHCAKARLEPPRFVICTRYKSDELTGLKVDITTDWARAADLAVEELMRRGFVNPSASLGLRSSQSVSL